MIATRPDICYTVIRPSKTKFFPFKEGKTHLT